MYLVHDHGRVKLVDESVNILARNYQVDMGIMIVFAQSFAGKAVQMLIVAVNVLHRVPKGHEKRDKRLVRLSWAEEIEVRVGKVMIVQDLQGYRSRDDSPILLQGI